LAEYFFDTSAFVKRYHPEAGTQQALALFSNPKNRVVISRLSLVEMQSAFAVKVRTGEISQSTAAMLWLQLMADLSSGAFEVLPVTDGHYQVAGELIERYGFRHRLRTLDALQLAVGSDKHHQAGVDGFVLADQALAEVASAEKLPIVFVS
jgi:predicted nucleic acid-binding protein